MTEDEKKQKIQEMEQAISNAIQNLCILAHELTGHSQVMVNIIHVSDAMTQTGASSFNVSLAGEKREGCGEECSCGKPEEKVDPAKLVEDVVSQSMAKAKEKNGGQSNAPENK
jgi:hypothetical protein